MIVAGFGFTTRATAHSVADALQRTGCSARIDAVATAADKAPALVQMLGRSVVAIAAVDLALMETSTQSAASQLARGTGSVAEAAALAAAGKNARLLVPRCISTDRMATCAIATGDPQ